MSNTLAIATVSAALKQLLNQAIRQEFLNAAVKYGQPAAPEAEPTPEVNISLYQITPNVSCRNNDLPTRSSSGRLVIRPSTALDLKYLISFYGNEDILEPQRLMGRVVEALNSQPVLTNSLITEAIQTYSFLNASDLNQEPVAQVKFTLVPATVEELTKIWSSLYHTVPYSLSVIYHADVVVINSQDTPDVAKPMEEINLSIMPRLLAPTHKAGSITFSDLNNVLGQLSGDVEIGRASDETDMTDYALYWGTSRFTKIIGRPPIAILPKTDENLTHTFTNAAIPANAAYLLAFTRNQGVEMSEGIAKAIHDANQAPVHQAAAVHFQDTGNTPGVLSGNITITKATNETDITHYVIYWGANNLTKLSETPVATLAKTGSDLTHTLTDEPLPNGATHFLVFTRQDSAEMAEGVSGLIRDDNLAPLHPAVAVSFTDTNSTADVLSGDVYITRAIHEDDITHYALYWGSDETTKIEASPLITTIAKTGGNLTQPLSSVGIPSGATHLLVHTRNQQAEMTDGISVAISDKTS